MPEKLVRDKIPDIIKERGEFPVVHTASDEEYRLKLKEKLSEEVNEFLKSNDKEELADILEVIYAICDSEQINMNRLDAIRKEKAKKKGIFRDKLILESDKL